MTETDDVPNVVQAITRVMNDVGAVKKTGEGDVPYKFRGIDQVMNALNPALVKHGVVVVPCSVGDVTTERLSNGRAQGVVLKMGYRIYGPKGDWVDVAGVGGSTDYGDKAVNQAMSMAYKYAILEAFCIPTEDMQEADTRVVHVDNASSAPPTVDLGRFINNNLSKNERALLREAWKADFSFPTSEAPAEREEELKTLIKSYKGVADAATSDEETTEQEVTTK